MRFSEPLIRDRAVLFFDDWDWDLNAGEKKALEEFLADFPVEPLPSYTPAARVFLATRRKVQACLAGLFCTGLGGTVWQAIAVAPI